MMDDDSILPPITAGRVKGIAEVWLRDDAMHAYNDLRTLADWMDNYQRFVREALESASERN